MAAGSHCTAFQGHCQAQLFCDPVILQQDLPNTKVLKELVEELLGVCQVLTWRNFMLELHPGPGCNWDTCCECCSIQESSSTYHPLVILRPPPGHSFSLDSTDQPPAGHIRVVLECLCSGEQLLGQRCFLPASGGSCPGIRTGTCWTPCAQTRAWIQRKSPAGSRCWWHQPGCFCTVPLLPALGAAFQQVLQLAAEQHLWAAPQH